MLNRISQHALSEPNIAPLYLVERGGIRVKPWFVEFSRDESSREQVIRDICNLDIEWPIRVLEIFEELE